MNLQFTVTIDTGESTTNPSLLANYAPPVVTSTSGNPYAPGIEPGQTATYHGNNFINTTGTVTSYYWPTLLGNNSATGGILYGPMICSCMSSLICGCPNANGGIGNPITFVIYVGNQPSAPITASWYYSSPSSIVPQPATLTSKGGENLSFTAQNAGYVGIPQYLLTIMYGTSTNMITALNCNVAGVGVSQTITCQSPPGTTFHYSSTFLRRIFELIFSLL
jgi:hypothetical protein